MCDQTSTEEDERAPWVRKRDAGMARMYRSGRGPDDDVARVRWVANEYRVSFTTTARHLRREGVALSPELLSYLTPTPAPAPRGVPTSGPNRTGDLS